MRFVRPILVVMVLALAGGCECWPFPLPDAGWPHGGGSGGAAVADAGAGGAEAPDAGGTGGSGTGGVDGTGGARAGSGGAPAVNPYCDPAAIGAPAAAASRGPWQATPTSPPRALVDQTFAWDAYCQNFALRLPDDPSTPQVPGPRLLGADFTPFGPDLIYSVPFTAPPGELGATVKYFRAAFSAPAGATVTVASSGRIDDAVRLVLYTLASPGGIDLAGTGPTWPGVGACASYGYDEVPAVNTWDITTHVPPGEAWWLVAELLDVFGPSEGLALEVAIDGAAPPLVDCSAAGPPPR